LNSTAIQVFLKLNASAAAGSCKEIAMVTESDNPQFADSHDGRQSRDPANWSGKEPKQPKGRKGHSPAPKQNSGASAKLPAFAPTGEDQQHLMIAEAAYYRAEKRGFTEGYSLDDWLVAEAEIKGMHSS
jgi:hypothetical protein